MRNLYGPARIAKEKGRKPQGIYRGRLAEPYDGIGQYVSVALAGSSVGSAYKARVAAGDFGGGRTFPKGTPVTVFSFRGNLEVMLGNIPSTGCPCGDPFSRVEAVGLGTGPLGTYEMPWGSEDFYVDGESAWFREAVSGVPYAYLRPSQAPTLPLEVLFKMKMHSNLSPFTGWSGIGNATYNDFEFFAQLPSNPSSPNYDVISFYWSGIFPSSQIAFGETLERVGGTNQDFDDVMVSIDNTINPVEIYFRYYADKYGVYGRIWQQGSVEPTTIAEGMVKPYNLWPEPYKSTWVANGGGKGEAWHAYEASFTALPEAELIGFDFGSNGAAGSTNNDTWAVIDDVCIIQGGWC